MRPRLPESIQQEIWNRSKTETIRQMANRFGIDKGTVKKYANPQYI